MPHLTARTPAAAAPRPLNTLAALRGDSKRGAGGGAVLDVKRLQYWGDNGRMLLRGVSLRARPGEVTAVLGGSGTGTTLLLTA